MSENLAVHIVDNPDGSSYAIPLFEWDLNRHQAAVDLAEGQYSLTEIAGRARVTTHVLKTWREHPQFKARVEERTKAFAELAMSYGLAVKAARMQMLQDRHDRMQAVVDERGRWFSEKAPEVPGGATGYVYAKETKYGREYYIDNKTAAALSDVEKQAAIEAGQWADGSGPSVAIQIVAPTSAPPASALPTVTIGTLR